MKLKLLILSLFIGFIAQAQTPLPGSTLVNARYQWLAGKFNQLKIPMYADTTQYPLWLPRVGGDMMLDTAGADAGVIYVRYNMYWHGVSGNGGTGDTTGYKFFSATYPLILNGSGDTAYLSIDTTGFGGGGGSGTASLKDPYSLRDAGISTQAGFSAYLASRGDTATVILMNKIIPVTTNLVIPANFTLIFENRQDSAYKSAGGFLIDTLRTVTPSSQWVYGNTQWIYGGGNIVLNRQAFPYGVNPVWWGAQPSAPESGTAIKKMLAVVGNNQITINLPNGSFNTSLDHVLPSNVTLKGQGPSRSTLTATRPGQVLLTAGSGNVIEDLGFKGSDTASIGVNVPSGNRIYINRIRIENFDSIGLKLGAIQNSKFTEIFAQFAKYNFLLDGPENCVLDNVNGNNSGALSSVDSSGREIWIKDARGLGVYEGIFERGNLNYQLQVDAGDGIVFHGVEFNGAKVAPILINGGSVSFDHCQFTNSGVGFPNIISRITAGSGLINVEDITTLGSGSQSNMNLYQGPSFTFSGSTEKPILAFNLGANIGSAQSGGTITHDPVRRKTNIAGTTTFMGWQIGYSSGQQPPAGTILEMSFTIKGISNGNPVAVYISLPLSPTRRLLGYFPEGYHKIQYICAGDESYRWQFTIGESVAKNYDVSNVKIVALASDSTNMDASMYGTTSFLTPMVMTASDNSARLATTAWTNALLKQTNKNLPTKGRVTVTDYSSITTSPRLWYEGFNSNTVMGDTVYTTFARKFNHVDPGWNPLLRSVDGGMTWDSINVLAKPGNAVAIGSADDTLFYSYEKAPFSTKQYFGYSIDFGRTLVLSDSISDPGFATCTFGRMIKLPSGKKIWPFYHLNTVSNWKIGLYQSIDGVHWTIGSIVDQQTSGTPNLNEAWVEWINPEVTTDAQVKLMYIARDELAKGHIQYNSSNGGATWTRIGRINALYTVEDEYGFPADLTLYGGKLYLVAGRRVTIPGGSTAPDRHVSVLMADPARAFVDTNAWSQPNRIYNAEADYRTDDVFNNFGYFFTYVLKGEMRMIGYDQDPRTVYGDSVKTRMMSMPVFGIGMTEAYNATNQVVSANTETLVSTPLEWYNSDLFHSTTTDTITVKTDGFYHFDASLTLTPELDGSYSKVYIKVIDPGDPVGNRIIAADVLYPTLNQDSYRIRISGTEFIRAFEKVVFCIYSDAARTIRNQLSKDDRARIKMKKL